MPPSVHTQVFAAGKADMAHLAAERLLTAVDSLVHLQGALLRETSFTFTTFVRFLTRVRTVVNTEFVFLGKFFWDRVHTDTVSDPCGSSCGPGGYHVGQSFFHRLYTGVASHLCASVDACSGHTAAQIPCCRIHSSNASCWHHFPISYDWFSLSSRGLRSVQCLSWYGLRCLY